jgi:hypothetical protein
MRHGASHRRRLRLSSIASLVSSSRAAVIRNNVLYLVIGALVVVVAVLSYQLYQDRHPPEGMSIKFGPNGLSIQGNGK